MASSRKVLGNVEGGMAQGSYEAEALSLRALPVASGDAQDVGLMEQEQAFLKAIETVARRAPKATGSN